MKTVYFFVVLFIFSFAISSCATTVHTKPAKVVVIKKLPKHYKVVYIKGHRYFKWNKKLYRKTRSGYILVRV